MDRERAERHWIALDAVFSRTLSPGTQARARAAFDDHAAAINDVYCQLLLNDPTPELRTTAAALRRAMQSAWRTKRKAR